MPVNHAKETGGDVKQEEGEKPKKVNKEDRELMGVARVGELAKGLLLSGRALFFLT